ncbi:MAG TPA: riboflavin synthase [Aestuariivirgaceae bacterium]|jgi:riboflavin synthase
MFTGIISDIGEVIDVEKHGDTRLKIASRYPAASIAIGSSICCSGICFTVVDVQSLADGRSAFSVEASAETSSKSSIDRWKKGTRINLERPLKVGDELSGHLVSGHVDGVGTITFIKQDGQSKRFGFRTIPALIPYIASKGSICLDGTSLTVNEVDRENFGVNLIPHTLKVTAWSFARVGDVVNIEIDMLARYVARLQEFRG